MKKASRSAENISYTFKNTNQLLSEAWEDVSEFMTKIDEKMIELLDDCFEEIKNFCENTYSNEAEATQAATKANFSAASILSSLGIE